MGCEGLTGVALRKCMKKYIKNSKKYFPSFNVETDTVITKMNNSSTGIIRQTDRLKQRRKQKGETAFTRGSGSYPYISNTLFKKNK
tara:strand:- start:266 stop:523 length:258 start_codon:yes stop_codon:yes gene_type:complete